MRISSRWATAVGVLVFAVCTTMLSDVSAKRFIVGGNMGWTSNVNYTLWAGNQTFYLGDWLFFVYDRNQNDVLEVNATNYETCNAEHPLHNYTTGAGRDVVPLNVTRDYYFISSKGFCYGGMKLHAHVIDLPPPPQAATIKSHSSRFTYDIISLVVVAVADPGIIPSGVIKMLYGRSTIAQNGSAKFFGLLECKENVGASLERILKIQCRRSIIS